MGEQYTCGCLWVCAATPPSRQESLPEARCQSVLSPAKGAIPGQLSLSQEVKCAVPESVQQGVLQTAQPDGVIIEGGFGVRRCVHHFQNTGASDSMTTTRMTLSMCLAISNCGPSDLLQ